VEDVRTVALPGPAVAATSDGTRVWCVAGGRLLAYAATGALLLDVDEPPGLRSLAASGDTLAAVLEPGVIVWLEPSKARVLARLPLGGEPAVVAGPGAVWALDRRLGSAWPLAGQGAIGDPVRLGAADRVAPEAERVWWTSREDTLLRDGERTVDLGVAPGERGGLTVSAGAVWLSVSNALLHVGAWSAELGPPLRAPEGPVEHLTSADGIVVGGSGRQGLFVLDPSVDADVRHLDVEVGGELAHLVATRTMAWAFPAGKAEARLVRVRPGE
jgi:hypothetical protein